jgi:hypothetical protein
MSEMPVFFVPKAEPETWEARYAELAGWCNLTPPAPDKRVYSIQFRHDGDEWTATVGRSLSGTRRQCKGRQTEETGLADPAVVLAIFPGRIWMVVTDHRIAGGSFSKWQNPFMAGKPESVSYFAPPA